LETTALCAHSDRGSSCLSCPQRAPYLRPFFSCYRGPRRLHSFPTRRSSDLEIQPAAGDRRPAAVRAELLSLLTDAVRRQLVSDVDRKSTRLNSSHLGISYAVFCLKKKKIYDSTFR